MTSVRRGALAPRWQVPTRLLRETKWTVCAQQQRRSACRKSVEGKTTRSPRAVWRGTQILLVSVHAAKSWLWWRRTWGGGGGELPGDHSPKGYAGREPVALWICSQGSVGRKNTQPFKPCWTGGIKGSPRHTTAPGFTAREARVRTSMPLGSVHPLFNTCVFP